MVENIELFLNNTLGDSGSSFLMNAIGLLDDIGSDDYLFPLRNLLGDSDNIDNEVLVENIRLIVSECYDNILKSMTVFCKEDCPLTTQYNILFTLSNIESYEGKEEIKAIIDLGETPEETVAEIVKRFTATENSITLEGIEKVDLALIDRIEELCTKTIANDKIPQFVDKSKIQERARKFFSRYPETYIRELIRNGYRLGERREDYIKALEDYFSSHDPDPIEIAKELTALTVATETENDPVVVAKELTNSFITDASMMIKTNAMIENFYKGAFNEER
jgi:hypothetical protein